MSMDGIKHEIKHKISRFRVKIVIILLVITLVFFMAEIIFSYKKNYDKKNTTILLFSETYEIKYLCRTIGGSDAEMANYAVNNFVKSYSNVIARLKKSEYLPVKSEDFGKFIDDQGITSLSNDGYQSGLEKEECETAIKLLNALSERANSEQGKKISAEWASSLSP